MADNKSKASRLKIVPAFAVALVAFGLNACSFNIHADAHDADEMSWLDDDVQVIVRINGEEIEAHNIHLSDHSLLRLKTEMEDIEADIEINLVELDENLREAETEIREAMLQLRLDLDGQTMKAESIQDIVDDALSEVVEALAEAQDDIEEASHESHKRMRIIIKSTSDEKDSQSKRNSNDSATGSPQPLSPQPN